MYICKNMYVHIYIYIFKCVNANAGRHSQKRDIYTYIYICVHNYIYVNSHHTHKRVEHIRQTIELNQVREAKKKEMYKLKEEEALERLRLLVIEKEHEDQRKQMEREHKERARQYAIDKVLMSTHYIYVCIQYVGECI